MNEFFLNQLPSALLLFQGKTLIYANEKGKSLYQELPDAVDSLQCEEITFLAGKFSCRKVVQGEETLYILDPAPETPLHGEHTSHLFRMFREDLSKVCGKVDVIAEKKWFDPATKKELEEGETLSGKLGEQVNSLNHHLCRVLRNLDNGEILSDESLHMPTEPLDVKYILAELFEYMEKLCPELKIDFEDCHGDVFVMGNEVYLRKALGELFCNVMKVTKGLNVKLISHKNTYHLQISGDSTRKLSRSVGDILSGEGRPRLPQPDDGAGLGLLAVKNILQQMNFGILGELNEQGQLVLRVTMPREGKLIPEVASIDNFFKRHGGVPDLLLTLSPVLSDESYSFYYKEGQE